MYCPEIFKQIDTETVYALIRDYPLASVIYRNGQGLQAEHMPFYLDMQTENGCTGAVLQGHVAHGNPLWQEIKADAQVLLLFQGPQGYITPSWYASKQETHRVVPTWNYAVAHIHGRARAVKDESWILRHLDLITTKHEASFAQPWSLHDAPIDFMEAVVKRIVGIEVEIDAIEAKWKLSQNRQAADRESVVRGLETESAGSKSMISDLLQLMRKELNL